MSMNDRFEVAYKETKSAGLEKRIIYVDKETGVNYLYVQNGYGGGLTPLLDADGKPGITKSVFGEAQEIIGYHQP